MAKRTVKSQITTPNLVQATLSGSISFFSFSEIALWPIVFFSIIWFLFLLKNIGKIESFWVGWFFGIGYFGSNIWWIHISIENFGFPNSFLAVTLNALFISLLSLYFSIFGLLTNLVFKLSIIGALMIPFFWLLMEIARSYFFTGFPWLILGYSQIDSPFSNLFPLIGAYGISFVVVAISFCAFSILSSSCWLKKIKFLCLFGLFSLMIYALNDVQYTSDTSAPLKISIIQGSVTQDKRWSDQSTELILERYMELSQDEWKADVVVWPETVFTELINLEETFIQMLLNKSNKTETALIIGIPFHQKIDNKIFNSILVLGSSNDLYKKRKLVPFGEYFPFRRVLADLYSKIDIPLSDFDPGPTEKNSVVVKGRSVGLLICYEIAFASIARSSLPKAELIINVSNDSWFGNTVAAFQHLQIVRVRAAELGRPIIRATNTGISAFIDHRGKLLKVTDKFTSQIITNQIVGQEGETFYGKIGEKGIVSGLLILIILVSVLQFLGRQSFKTGNQ